MLDWLFPSTFPIDKETRTWIDWRTEKLARAFGKNRIFGGEMIVPDAAFHTEVLPLPATAKGNTPGSEHEAFSQLVAVVARQMGIAHDQVETVPLMESPRRPIYGSPPLLDPTEWRADVAGACSIVNNKFRVATYRQMFVGSWENLVAAVAHQLAHCLLLQQGDMQGNETDFEVTTELLAAYLGFGIFQANGEILFLQGRTYEILSEDQKGLHEDDAYVTYPAFGYALALWAQRNRTSDSWNRRLRLDVRHAYKKSQRWLRHQSRHGKVMEIVRGEEGDAPTFPQAFTPPAEREDDCSGNCSCGGKNRTNDSCNENIESHDQEGDEFIPVTPDDYFTRAMFHMKADGYENALSDFEEAIALGGDDADFHIGRAQALLKLHRLEDALDEANQAVAQESEEPAAYLIRAQVSIGLERFDEAIEDASWLIDGDLSQMPNDLHYWEAYYVRGVAHSKQGDLERSVADLSIAIDQRETPELLAFRAEVYDLLGKTDKAARDRQAMHKDHGSALNS